MNEMLNAMIAMQEQVLKAQREQIAMAGRMMAVGQDMVAAQKQQATAFETTRKAWGGWFALWGVKP